MKIKATLLTLGLLGTGAYADQSMNSSQTPNDKALYSYKTYPDLKFWYDNGRPYWTETTSTYSYAPVIERSFDIRMISFNDNNREIAIDKRIFFPVDQAELTEKGQEYLDEIARKLNANEGAVDGILIQGHASKPGTKEYNRELSRKRAVNVKEYLVSQGVNPNLFTVESFGERDALDNRRESRRVEIQDI